MSIPNEERVTVNSIFNYVSLAAKDALTQFTSQTRKALIFYFATTILCLVLDLVNFFT